MAATPAGWVVVSTPDGELVTDAEPEVARQAAERLQRFAQVLRAAAPVPPLDTRRAVILAFAGAGAFETVRPRQGARAFEVDGFVQGGPVRTLAVVNLSADRPDPMGTLDHEYVHLALNGALPAQPPWLAEGLAEVLSDWHEDEAGAAVGSLRPEHVRVLLSRPLVPMDRLLAAGYTSPEFTDRETRAVFYAQSWALVRLLLEGGDAAARRRVLDFLADLGKGAAAPIAFHNAFGFGVDEARGRVLRSLAGKGPDALPAIRLPRPPAPSGLDHPTAVAPGRVKSLLGELLLRQDRDAEARKRLEEALGEDPGLASAHESLAHLALKRARWQDARQHLEAAFRSRPDDPAALHRMAELLVREAGARGEVPSGESEQTAVGLLERAVALAPHYADAADLLAHLRPEPRGERIRMLERALAHNPGRVELAFTLAGLHLGAQDPQAAGAVLVRARDGARNDTHRFLAEHLLRRLGEATAGTMEASGRLLALECQPGGALDFVVEAAPGMIAGGLDLVLHGRPSRRPSALRRLRLRAATPSSVLLQDGAGEILQRELVCGPQQGAVRARYRPLTDSAPPAADGALLTLRFLPGR